MSDYDEDFETYDEDFEAPGQPQQLLQHQDSASPAAAAPAATLHEQYRPWHHPTPGSADGAVHGPKAPAAFTRSLVAAPGSWAPATSDSLGPEGVLITTSPPPPPLTDRERTRASKVLSRSLQLMQQRPLGLTPQLQLLALPPLTRAQQFTRGVGVYAGTRAAACQTRQLNQDLQEQDVQTAEVRQAVMTE
eukprot:gene5024-5266_t